MALKLKQYYVYQFSTFSFLNDEENKMVDELKKYSKDALREQRIEFTNAIKKYEGQRTFRNNKSLKTSIDNFLKNKKSSLVSVFESDLTQWIENNKPEFVITLGHEKKLLHGVVFLKVNDNHYEVMQQILNDGAVIDGHEYVVYTASAGQQRNTKLTLIEKSIMKDFIQSQYMCGLSVDRINQTDGLNTGKYLAYLSLPMSASTPINIDIDRVIVVDDMELSVNKTVEFIDHENGFSHSKVNLPDALNMTDGCGMLLPEIMENIKNQLNLTYPLTGFQIRGSWIKGAIFPFDFKAFCLEKEKANITDIWGKKYNVLNDNIQMILTKSQLKTWGKYDNWDQYKKEFKKQNLTFSVTAVNNPAKNEIQLAYQFIQTLDRDKADEEHIKALCSRSIDYYKKLHSDTNIILQRFGACAGNENIKPFQEALMLYPSLLKDTFVRERIEKMVAGFKRELLCSQLLSEGFYGYAMPDLYAFCEYLFLGEKNPEGLIPDNYVYCRYYEHQDIKRADILRSPCLSNEHSPRNILHSENCKKWFGYCGQNIIYSIHDYLMLCVQGDVDGDSLAIVPSDTLIDMVKPHDVLFYRMYKAPAQQINNESIYNTLVNSFGCNTEGNSIGYISNTISKCWNQDNLDDDTMNLIKYLTMKSNFTIDFPKTQKNIDLPPSVTEKYYKIMQSPFPYVFKYIKGKKTVSDPNDSVLNKIVKYIEENTKGKRYTYQVDDFEYSMLQRRDENGNVVVNRYSKKYKQLIQLCFEYGRKIQILNKELKEQSIKDDDEDIDECSAKYDLAYSFCLMDMLKLYEDKEQLTNALVDICYCQNKIPGINNLIWSCCGDVIVKNLISNQNRSDYKQQTRARAAYQKGDIEKIEAIKSKLEIILDSRFPVITQHDLAILKTIEKERERRLYFALLCLAKIMENHKVYIAVGQKSKLNKNKLLIMAGISSKAVFINLLRKLEASNLIKVDVPKHNGGKIITLLDYDFEEQSENIITIKNTWNLSIYYEHLFQDKKLCTCMICGKDIIKEGNKKTCGERCSKFLEKKTKQKQYNKSKVDKVS